MSIGKVHQAQVDSVKAILHDLTRVSPAEYAEAFRRQITRLDDWKARIAAVGQVKAGKSTILNTLVGRPGFLPADVNPWTSVVTNMRINVASDPALGARFEFFDEKAWDRIINGDPELRKLATELLPDFDAEVLRQQTEEMRERAQRRLGRFYDKLLGSSHDYDMLTPELLERYVCAGPGADEGLERQALGRYTAITKVANLFMRNPEFAVPAIVTDTPGVNDPFLVRDEFTCQSLNDSDIFLVTLSAHQALTEVDVSLIRMLARHGSKEVIVFINRVDELEDFVTASQKIIDDVAARLFDAAPDKTFSIVAGSAWWAGLAIDDTADPDLVAEVAADPMLKRFLLDHRGECPDDPKARLALASGLSDVKRRISEAVEYGSGARFLAEVLGETRAQMNTLAVVSRRRRDTLQDQIETYGTGRMEDFLQDLETELAHVERLGAQMGRLIEQSEIDLDTVMNTAWIELQQAMDARTQGFLDTHAGMLKSFWSDHGAAADKRLEIDILPLREVMEAGLREKYDQARTTVDSILLQTLDRLTDLARAEVDAPDGYVDLEDLPGRNVVAAFVTARKSVTVRLVGRRQLAFWRKADLDIEATMKALRRITAAEVLPSSGKLVQSFTETLSERITTGKDRLRLVHAAIERLIADRRDRLQTDRDLLRGAGDLSLLKQKFVNRLQGDVDELEDLLQALATKENQLHRRTLINAA